MNDIRPAALARRALAFLVLSTVGLAACSTSGGAHEAAPVVTDGPSATEAPATTAPPSTATPSTEPAATTPPVTDPPITDPPITDPSVTDPSVTDPSGETASPPPDLSFLWNGVEEMVAAWNAANETISAAEPDTVQPLVVNLDDVTIGPLQSAGDGFAALGAFPPGFLSGTIDPGGEVSALVTTLDPTVESATYALMTSLTALAMVWSQGGIADTDLFVVDVSAAYDKLAAAPQGEPAQEFVPGPFGTPYVVVLSQLEEGAPGVRVIEVAAIPVPEEEVARSVVELLRLELRAVTG